MELENTLYLKHNFLDKSRKCIINVPIKSYDMKSGGYSILKKNKCFSNKEIEYLDKLPKYKRNIILGNMIRDNKWTKILMDGFIDARKRFCYYNKISDNDILSIKKDAIFLINKPASILDFDGYSFKLEAQYSSYYYLNEMELYFSNKNFNIDLKGINDTLLEKHKEFFLDDLCHIFRLVESNDINYRNKFLKNYRSAYLNKELDIGCYRELNRESMFLYKEKIGSQRMFIEETDDIDSIDITYNYKNYFLPLVRMII